MNKFVLNTKMVGIEDFGSVNDFKGEMIDLTIGEPSFTTDLIIKESSIQALLENNTKYPPSKGYEHVRQAIVDHENKFSNVNYNKNDVLVVNGGTEGLAVSLAVLLNDDDEVIVPTPAYAAYESLIQMNRGVYVPVDTTHSKFILTASDLKKAITPKTKVLMLTSPNNPTGTVYPKKSLEAIVDVIKETDIYVILDATYAHLIFDGEFDLSSLMEIKKQVILVYSLSKTYAMTGWRLGYVLADESMIHYLNKWHHCVVTGVSSFTQLAIVDALKIDVSNIVDSYQKRVQYVVDRLVRMGFDVIAPQGAFYVFPSLKGLDMDSIAFSSLCANNGLKIISGHFFGSDEHFRISCCYNMETIEKGMDCLEKIVASIRK